MKKTEILIQGEQIPDIQFVELEPGKGVKDVLAVAAKHRKNDVKGDFHVFVEDKDDALRQEDPLPDTAGGQPIRLHVHRCHRITVGITFNGTTKEHIFGPGATVATVKKWGAIRAFGMDAADAAEHVLQLGGSAERPEPDTHIGSLANCPDCQVAFDLVPLKRVEG